ncbi:MAG: hypothetical protein AAFY21_07035, partial [Cyanobacteria bacterium J06641_2]
VFIRFLQPLKPRKLAKVLPEEKIFYSNLGFAETDGSGEMILSEEGASMLLNDLDQKRNLDTFD